MSDWGLDRYQNRDSPLHRLDPRAKLIFSLVYILGVALTGRNLWPVYAAFLLVIGLPLIFSKLDLKYVLKRSLTVLPLALAIAVFLPFFKPGQTLTVWHLFSWNITLSREGTEMLGAVMIKSWLSLLCLIWLTAVSGVNNLLQAANKLHFPGILVMILFFMYRYIFVIVDEMRRMILARDCRSRSGGLFWNIRTAGSMIGTLFVRSYERSERVYTAMAARGYDGQTHSLDELRFKTSDGLILAFLLAASLAIIGINFVIRV